MKGMAFMMSRNTPDTGRKSVALTDEQVFGSLSDDYSCIFYVNLAENRLLPSRLSEPLEQRFGKRLREKGDYRQLMLSYVLGHVDKNEQEKLIQSFLPERLMLHLRGKGSLVCECHEVQDGRRMCHRIKAAALDPSGTQAIIGVAYGLDAESAHAEYHVGSSCVLLVGSDAAARQELAGMLQSEFRIRTADGAGEAMALLRRDGAEITAVVMDLETSQWAGKELLRKLQAEESCRDIPVLVTALTPGDESALECLNLGAAEVLVLPYQAELVALRVAGTCKLREATAMLSSVETDPLTGLYTKPFFFRYVTAQMREHPEKQYEIICSDIENFRAHNERYGTAVGDLLLTYVAGQLKEKTPGALICGRLSDDVFAVLRERDPFLQRDEVLRAARRGAPVPNLVMKFGIVRAEPNVPVQLLCDHALSAIARIKQVYGVSFAEYDDSMRQEMVRRQEILDSMETALEQGQFQVYYQPKHRTADGKVAGAEALVRWIHPKFGFMSPAEFIPMFERIGFIRGLDRYIWARVCGDMARWRAMGLPVVPVSINLSRRDFESGDLAQWILDLTGKMGLPHDLIHAEVTESAFTANPKMIADCIRTLHQAGFVIELDDFGAGYSSMTTLNSMDLDVMKIDMSIIRQDVPGSERNVLEFCLQLARMMGLKTVAEGVETEAQYRRLAQLGCDCVQGYYFAKPMPCAEFEQYLRSH